MKVLCSSAVATVFTLASIHGCDGKGLRSQVGKTRPLLTPTAGHGSVTAVAALGDSPVSNVNVFVQGIDTINFDLWEETGNMGEIFRVDYTKGKVVDGFEVPDGLTLTKTTYCSVDASSSTITGGSSFVENESKSISMKAGYNVPLIAKASFQGSAEYKSTVEKTQDSENVITATTMKCDVYQLKLEEFDLPLFTNNWLNGVTALKSGKIDALKLVKSFGTGYILKATMGSRVQRQYITTKTQYKELSSTSSSVSAAAEVAAKGASIGTSGMSTSQQNEMTFFNDYSTQTSLRTLGVPPPMGNSDAELQAQWLADTKTSTSLGLSHSIEWAPLDELFDSSLLDVYNAQLDTAFTEEELASLKSSVSKALTTYCENQFGGVCAGPSADASLPSPYEMFTVYRPYYGGTQGQKFAPSTKQLVGRIESDGVAKFDMEVTQIQCRYNPNNSRLEFLGWTLTGSYGAKNQPQHYPNQAMCEGTGGCETVDIPYGTRVRDVRVYKNVVSGSTYISGVSVKVNDDWVTCGRSDIGAYAEYVIDYKSTLAGFWGRINSNPSEIVALAPIQFTAIE